MQEETEGTMRRLCHQELRNELQHDIAVRWPPNSFLASLWIKSGLGWPERDFGVAVQLCHVESCFEAVDESFLTAPLVLYSFFTIQTLL